jgi:crotonobetaine/carnitine-CoA ligase
LNLLNLDDPEDRLLGRCLRRQAEMRPDADFILWDDERHSFGRVNELANAAARGFERAGVAAGDTVSFLMGTCPEWIWTTLGLNKLGAIWIPTNVDYKGRWLRESLEDGRARVLVADAALLPRVAELGGHPFERIYVRGDASGHDLGVPLLPIEELVSQPGPEPDDSKLYYGDTSAILWTSGTTGRSKGVMQSHNVWLLAGLSGLKNSSVRAGDVAYNCLPMYQSAAWVANVYRSLVGGIPCAMDPAFSASEFWDRTRHYGATLVFTLGAMHMFLLNAPEQENDADNPVRVAGFVPTPDHLMPVFQKRFGIEQFFQGFGQSEVFGALNRSPGKTYTPNALGDETESVQVKLLDDDDREVAPGAVGEFCVRPKEPYAIFNGYWNNPEATLSAWRNLWYHTGDLGRQDEQGDYFFVDRKQDFIRYKGRNISSFAVEAALGAHPAVLQCAVHGIPSAELEAEAEVKACVILKPGEAATPDELCRFVNDNAPYFFVPRYVEIVDELPQTPTGRVQKFKLRERGLTQETWDGKTAGFEIRR